MSRKAYIWFAKIHLRTSIQRFPKRSSNWSEFGLLRHFYLQVCHHQGSFYFGKGLWGWQLRGNAELLRKPNEQLLFIQSKIIVFHIHQNSLGKPLLLKIQRILFKNPNDSSNKINKFQPGWIYLDLWVVSSTTHIKVDRNSFFYVAFTSVEAKFVEGTKSLRCKTIY